MKNLPNKKIWYLVTVCINLIQNRPNSSCLTEYRCYLTETVPNFAAGDSSNFVQQQDSPDRRKRLRRTHQVSSRLHRLLGEFDKPTEI